MTGIGISQVLLGFGAPLVRGVRGASVAEGDYIVSTGFQGKMSRVWAFGPKYA